MLCVSKFRSSPQRYAQLHLDPHLFSLKLTANITRHRTEPRTIDVSSVAVALFVFVDGMGPGPGPLVFDDVDGDDISAGTG